VTLNLKHFPTAVRDSFGIEARHRDEFVLHLPGLSTGTVLVEAAPAASRRLPFGAHRQRNRQSMPITNAVIF
jgi:hypothetical protein